MNKNLIKNTKLLFFVIIGLILLFFLSNYVNKYIIKSKADTPKVNVTFSPNSGETNFVSIILMPDSLIPEEGKIDAIDIKLLAEGDIDILRVGAAKFYKSDSQSSDGNISENFVKILKSDITNVVYVNSALAEDDDSERAKMVLIPVEIYGEIGDSGKIIIDEDASVITSTHEESDSIVEYELNPIPCKSGTYEIASESISTGIKLNLSLKFQGIQRKPMENLNSMNVAVRLVKEGEESGTVIPSQTGAFTVDDNEVGIWHGSVTFLDVTSGNFKVYIKGPRHIQKKICEDNPKDLGAVGSYYCKIGESVPLVSLPEENDLDFSEIYLLSGDLPEQNGIVDSYDISYLRNNLGKTGDTICDINLDGVCDSQDYSLLIQALGVKYDEE